MSEKDIKKPFLHSDPDSLTETACPMGIIREDRNTNLTNQIVAHKKARVNRSSIVITIMNTGNEQKVSEK